MATARAREPTAGRIIEPGGPVDRMSVGDLAMGAARELVAASPADPKRHRIDIYRPVSDGQRLLIVRIKLTVAFATARRGATAKTSPV